MPYRTKTTNALYELYQQYNEKMEEAKGIWGILWKSIRGEIPLLLEHLDSDDEARRKVAKVIGDLAKAMEEDYADDKEIR